MMNSWKLNSIPTPHKIVYRTKLETRQKNPKKVRCLLSYPGGGGSPITGWGVPHPWPGRYPISGRGTPWEGTSHWGTLPERTWDQWKYYGMEMGYPRVWTDRRLWKQYLPVVLRTRAVKTLDWCFSTNWLYREQLRFDGIYKDFLVFRVGVTANLRHLLTNVILVSQWHLHPELKGIWHLFYEALREGYWRPFSQSLLLLSVKNQHRTRNISNLQVQKTTPISSFQCFICVQLSTNHQCLVGTLSWTVSWV